MYLKELFKTLGQSLLLLTRVGGTHWVPHIQWALSNLLTGYGPIVQHLEQIQNPNDSAHTKDSSAKGKNYLKMPTQADALHFLFYLWDVVSGTSKVSTTFQEEATIAEIHMEDDD